MLFRYLILFCFSLLLSTGTFAASDYTDKAKAWARHQSLEQASWFMDLPWRDIGPVMQGGRIVDIEVVPGNPHEFYVAYASGGVWKTRNNGITFEPLSDAMPTMISGDLAVDPNRPEVIWYGTGEANSSRSSYGGMGVYQSTDGGENWKHMGLGETDRIGRILVHPDDSNTIYVAALGRLYSKGGQRGVYRSRDGGKSWQQVLPGKGMTGAVDLVMHPENPDVLYAATWERSRSAWNFVEGGDGSAVWKTTDGGDNWQRLAGGLPRGEHVGRVALAISASSPETVYVGIDNQELLPEADWDLGEHPLSPKRLRGMDEETFISYGEEAIEDFIRANDLETGMDAGKLVAALKAGELTVKDLLKELGEANANLFSSDIKGQEVYRSDDGGKTWRLTHQQPIRELVFSFGYYFGQIRVAPDNPDQVYLLGVPLLKSDDGGQTFRGIMPPEVHVDHHALWIDPQNSQHLMLGNDGGLDISWDGGGSWMKLDRQPVGQFYTVAVDMAKPYNIYGGTQDNGTIQCASTNRWQDGPSCKRVFGGDGMYVNVDFRDNKTRYVGYQFGNYVRQDGKGNHSIRPRDKIGEPALRYNWNTPVVLSRHNQDVVYFGANKVFRSLDQGDSWLAISPDLTSSRNRGDVPYATITTLSESPLQFGMLWAGTDDGHVHVTENGGDRWRKISGPWPKKRWISRVEASAHQKERVYVAVNAYRDDEIDALVYRSDNLGREWINISKGLPAEAVNVIREDPVNAEVVYVGTDRGVYVSLNAGGSWQALQGGLPNVPVHDLVVHPRERELVAGTHGRSFWILDVLPLQDLTAEVRKQALHLFYAEDVKASRNWQRNPSLWRHRPEYDPSHTLHYWSASEGVVNFRVKNQSGAVLREMTDHAVKGVNTFKWDLMADQALALVAESTRNKEKESTGPLDTPYAEAVRLGQRMFLQPGKYTVEISRGDEMATVSFEIKAPKKREPRAKKESTIRGK